MPPLRHANVILSTNEGERTLKLPNEDSVKQAFEDEKITHILFVTTYEGTTPEWPA